MPSRAEHSKMVPTLWAAHATNTATLVLGIPFTGGTIEMKRTAMLACRAAISVAALAAPAGAERVKDVFYSADLPKGWAKHKSRDGLDYGPGGKTLLLAEECGEDKERTPAGYVALSPCAEPRSRQLASTITALPV